VNATRTLTIFNAGGTVERNGVLVPVKEEIPPFAVIVLGEPDKQAAGFDRDGVHVWRAYKPGANASLYRPEIIAINGPGRVPYGGYGEATQAWPAPAAVDLSETTDSERPGDLLKTHATLGPRNDSWCLHPGGGLFTQMGLHAPKAVSLGSTVDRTGERWENVTTPAVCWVSPRTIEVPWMTGWKVRAQLQAADIEIEVDPRRSVPFRMQQPYTGAPGMTRLFEPIADGIDHDASSSERMLGMTGQVFRRVRWVKVRDARPYRVSFSFSGGDGYEQSIQFGYWGGTPVIRDVQEIGVFAAWPDGDIYKCIPHPAAVAHRDPLALTLETRLEDIDEYYGYGEYGEVQIAGGYTGAQHCSATGIMELDAGWAFGFVPIFSPASSIGAEVDSAGKSWMVYRFQCLVERIGPPNDVLRFWEAIAAKVTYSASYGWQDWYDTDDPLTEYPVTEPESLIVEFSEKFLQPD